MIDVFLLSCRIIGKKIESAFLIEIINIVRGKGATKLLGQYITSNKNHLTKDFYKNHDFSLINKEGGVWEYDLKNIPKKINFIKTKKV
jgi:predicted enzyme involved in methoxymalonyl-ACP biosynthesis